MAEISLNNAVNKYCQYLVSKFGEQAILEHLEDLEDIRLADEAMAKIRSGKSKLLTTEELLHELYN